MNKYLKHLIIISCVFLSLIVVPFIAWLLIQLAINLGNICDAYISFLSRYFIEGVDQIIPAFSILIFLFSIACYIFWFIHED